MRRDAWAVVALLAAVWAAGCGGPGSGRQGEPIDLPMSTIYRAADVPVPSFFSLDEGRSFQIDSPLILHHVYRASRVEPSDVVRFYQKQMPVARWQPIGRVEMGGMRLLAFERGQEKCLIYVEKRFPGRTEVKIEVVGSGSRS